MFSLLDNPLFIQYRLAIYAVVLVALLGAAGTAGWKVNGWRLASKYAADLKVETDRYTALETAVNVQNAEVQALGDRTKMAEWVAVQAETKFKDLTKRNTAKVNQVNEIKPVDCRQMINKLKGGYDETSYLSWGTEYNYRVTVRL